MTQIASDRVAHATHFVTVDVEEWFQFNAFEHVLSRNDWGPWPQRLDWTVPALLQRLAHLGARGNVLAARVGWAR